MRKILSSIDQVKNNIKEELEKINPSPKEILSRLFNLHILTEGVKFNPKDEWRYIPDTDYFDIVGDIFNFNQEFYMKHLYNKVRLKLEKDMRKSRGISFKASIKEFKKKLKEEGYVGKLVEMDKYIFEKFCLNDGEQILLKSGGIIQGVGEIFGVFYVTNNRIISLGQRFLITLKKKRERVNNFSTQQKCYGYVVPIKNLSKLKKRKYGVSYNVELNGRARTIRIQINIKLPNREEHINQIFEFLSKRSIEEVQYS